MPDIALRLGRDMLVLEGAMGTMLQWAGLATGDGAPEALNLIEPEEITRIHHFYRLAGADCAITNTFGASRPKLAAYGIADLTEAINTAAVKLARAGGAPHILADIGPTGLVLAPLGEASFDEVYDAFKEQALALASAEPDAFLLETFTDIAEARCAVLACRDAAPDIPIIASVAFGDTGRMELSGTDPQTAALILEAAGAAAVGMNCGLGPEQMDVLAKEMLAATTLPVVVQPNAGIPTLDADGNTHFPGTAEDFEPFARSMYDAGVAAIGSCCGSDPTFTGIIADEISGHTVYRSSASVRRNPTKSLIREHAEHPEDSAVHKGVTIASPQRTLLIGGTMSIRAIGEQINPTGKPRLKESLLAGSMTLVRQLAATQQAAGADVLDINVGVAGIDELTTLSLAVQAVASSSTLPVSIDTTNAVALAEALKLYPGKALVNSVTGEERSLREVLPLVARYGAAVVVLALDDDGIPNTAAGRLAIVRKIRDAAREQGIPDENLLVDSLVMAAAADPDAPALTLETMRLVRKELGLATLLGVSNVSHGLPNRPALNAAFLGAAAELGLDAAIVNPADPLIVAVLKDSTGSSIAVFNDLLQEALKPTAAPDAAPPSDPTAEDTRSVSERLAAAITLGDADGAPELVDILVTEEGLAPGAVIEDILTPAIQRLGAGFATGEVFLPQLMVAADAMKAAVAQAKTHLLPADTATSARGTVVFATVKGDIHSIGKDICASLLESQSVIVRNLGVDVPLDTIVEAAADADAVCLSALMTTTLPAMEAATHALHERYPDLPVALGGAVVTQEWAAGLDALYRKDAPSLAALMVELLSKKKDGKASGRCD